MLKLIVVILALVSWPLSAQVVITSSNFPRTAGYLDLGTSADVGGVAVPAHGAGQIWNYNSLNAGVYETASWFSAEGDADYTSALNYRPQILSFNGMLIDARLYEAVDENGWYQPGRVITAVTYPIMDITGGPMDNLTFLKQVQRFDGRINTLEFPVENGKAWTNTLSETIKFELTVGAFGLNATPGERVQRQTEIREVVGEGKLQIPNSSGLPGRPLDALLIRVRQVWTDSFFLGGAPAPTPLLTAFGLSQGFTDSAATYAFYIEDFASPVIFFRLDASGAVSDLFWRPRAADIASSVSEVLTPGAVRAFPNPVTAGSMLTVDQAIGEASIADIVDITGRVVASTSARRVSDTQSQILLPSGIIPGVYTIALRGANASLLSTSVVMVY